MYSFKVSHHSRAQRGFAIAAMALPLAACSASSDSPTNEGDFGQARMHVAQVPQGVACLAIIAKGVSRTERSLLDVQPTQSSQAFLLQRQPVGQVEYLGAAFGVACSAVTDTTIADWISSPVSIAVLPGSVPDVPLVMRRNGRANVGVDFPSDELCMANGQPCTSDAHCCSNVCAAGICQSSTCASTNIALNTSGQGLPSPLESSSGWGGGALPWDILDGAHSYDIWARGLAFTGGHQNSSGGPPYIEPAGVRSAIVDFGTPKSFDRLVLWWHGVEHTPATGTIEYWNGAQWLAVPSVQRTYGTMHEEGTNSGYADSDIYVFPTVQGSKVRYSFDNSGNNVAGTLNIHGWLYEVEVFGCASGS